MNTRLTNRLTAVPSFDGQSLARAKEVDCPPEQLRALLDHDQGTARRTHQQRPAPYLVASAFRCSRTPPRAFGPGRFFVAENELEDHETDRGDRWTRYGSSTTRCGTASSRPASRWTWARSSRSPSSWRASEPTSSRPGSRSRARATSTPSRPLPRVC